MKPRNRFCQILLTSLFLITFVVGCGPSAETAVNLTLTVQVVSTHSAREVTATSTPPSVIKPSPTTTLTPVPTHTLTPTQRSSTSTPLPTLSPTDSVARTLDLLQSNGGCQLPCWWGLTPGVTSWQVAQNFLSQFASDIYVSTLPNDPLSIAFVKFLVPGDTSPIAIEHIYAIRDGLIEDIEVYNYDFVPAYYLTMLLNTYGSPSEVWIRTYRTEYQGRLPFGIALFYPERGIVAAYYPHGKVRGNKVQGCPQKGTSPFLGLWSPSRKMTFLDAIKTFDWYEEYWPFLSLEEAAQINEETFYQTFKDPNNITCLETPVDLWLPQQ